MNKCSAFARLILEQDVFLFKSCLVLRPTRKPEQGLQVVDILDRFYLQSNLSLSLLILHWLPLSVKKKYFGTVGLNLCSQHNISQIYALILSRWKGLASIIRNVFRKPGYKKEYVWPERKFVKMYYEWVHLLRRQSVWSIFWADQGPKKLLMCFSDFKEIIQDFLCFEFSSWSENQRQLTLYIFWNLFAQFTAQ